MINRFKYRGVMTIMALLVMAACILVGGQTPAEAGQTVKIFIDGREVPSDTSPEVIAERTYVPIRVISENLGAKVEWKQDTRQVVVNWRSTSTSSLPPAKQGEIQIIIDGQALLIPTDYGKSYATNGRIMIPLRVVGEALACEVKWIKESNTVDIKSKTSLPVISVNVLPSEKQASLDAIKPSNTSDIKILTVAADNQLLRDLAQYRTNLKLMDGSVINSEELMNKDAFAYSAEQFAVFKTYRDQLAKYQPTVILPTGELINAADLTITGNSYLTADQLKKWIVSETPRIMAGMTAEGLQFRPIPELAELYIKIGAQYGIRGDIAFCQAAKETGFWQFKGDVQPWQNNYCGLWAIGSPLTGEESLNGADSSLIRFETGVHGAIFKSPAAGVEAHIQHLYAYATKNPLPPGKALIDPRYSLVNRGIGPTWIKLNARWAVPGITYGQSILSDYYKKIL